VTSKPPKRRTRRYRLKPATVLRLKPGDTIVVTIERGPVSNFQADLLRQRVLKTIDPGNTLGLRVLVLSADIAVSVLRSEGLD
jgi:hypothetical protein